MSIFSVTPQTPPSSDLHSRKRGRYIDDIEAGFIEESVTKKRFFDTEEKAEPSERTQDIYNNSPVEDAFLSPFFQESPTPFAEKYSHGSYPYNPSMQKVWNDFVDPSIGTPPLGSPFFTPAQSSGTTAAFPEDDWSLSDEAESPGEPLHTPPRTPPIASKREIPETPWKKRKDAAPIPPGYKEYMQSAESLPGKLLVLQQLKQPFTIKICDMPLNGEIEAGLPATIPLQATITEYIEDLGHGAFHQAHLVMGYISNPDPNLEWTEPKPFVLKHLYKPKHLEKPAEAVRLFETERAEYLKITQALEEDTRFRVASHYDLDLLGQAGAEANPCHGCHLVEYIPEPMPETLHGTLLRNVKKLFQLCYKHQDLKIDLQKDNIKIDQDGKLVLIDPVHPHDKFRMIVDNCLKSFAKSDPGIEDRLDPRSS